MLIVKPPKEILKQMIEENSKTFDALAFNELDRNALDIKVFVDSLKYDELNINELDTNYLTNALDTLTMNAFQVGYNALTQLYVFDRNSYWQLSRHVRQDFTMLINKDRGYDITLTQDGTILSIKNTDNTTNKTIIKQGLK
jgi:hypothetical protein